MKEDRRIPSRAAAGRVAAVHAQIALVALMVVAQLWLLTAAWDELELGHLDSVITLTVASAVAFLFSLGTLITFRE